MNWNDPLDLSGLVLVAVAAFVGFLLPLIVNRGKKPEAADKTTMILKSISMALALAGIILLILV